MDRPRKHFYDFGPFSLNVTQRVLLREGRSVPFGPKAFQTLLVLLENRGRTLTRQELFSLLWPNSDASDQSTLSQQIRNIRRALGDDARGISVYIQTIPREGYSFVADVTERWAEVPAASPQGGIGPGTFARNSTTRRLALWVTVMVSIFGFAAWWLIARPPSLPNPRPVRTGRVLVRSTSEERAPTRIRVDHFASSLALSPDGRKLFATSKQATGSRTLSIFNTVNRTVRTVALPAEPRTLTVSADGKVYISSQIEGIMVFDIARDRLVAGLIPTHGSVWDMAITPDGKKLFLAMSQFGVKRLLVRTGELKQITNQQCPQYLELDPSGRHLYVSYQCSGPGGRPGHDSLEIFDAEKEQTLGVFTGPPMVGGHPSVAPDGQLVVLDGVDACQNPAYDEIGCPVTPSHIFHVFRPADRQIIRSFPASPVASGGPAPFVDSSRFVVSGASLTVIDATSGAIREKWVHGLGDYPSVVRSADGHHLFLGGDHAILDLELEGGACSPPQNGLAQFYSGDGTLGDAAGVTELTLRGDVTFVPGKVGQAFFFNRAGFLEGPGTANYHFGVHDSTLALYVKFAALQGEMTLVDRMATDAKIGFALVKSADNIFVFKATTSSGTLTVTSKNPAIENHWYHVAVTKTDRELSLYIDGERVDQGYFGNPPDFVPGDELRLRIGASNGGRAPLHGWLDEIAFYNRFLSPQEVKELYRSREYGPCKL
jgi:DNA-binding winged helix-turn-helix (wHTH) protein/DNA-binding beta-propeller fold protein YncE